MFLQNLKFLARFSYTGDLSAGQNVVVLLSYSHTPLTPLSILCHRNLRTRKINGIKWFQKVLYFMVLWYARSTQYLMHWCECHMSINSFIGKFLLKFPHPYHHTRHPIPNGHKGKSEKEPKSSSKLSQEGLEGIDKDLFLNLGVLGHWPKANRYLVLRKSPIVGLLFVHIQGVINCACGVMRPNSICEANKR